MCLNVISVPSFKSDLAALQSKFATIVCELEEMKSRPVLLGACKLCPTLRSELEERSEERRVGKECHTFKSNLTSLQSKFATVVCELEEIKSRPVLLGACKLCPTLRSELDEKNALIKSLGKTKVVESSPSIDCSVCPVLISDLNNLAVEKANLENENTYLRAILSWVSSCESQLA